LSKTNSENGTIQMWLRTALSCGLLVIASNPSDSLAKSRDTDAGIGNIRMAFLSAPRDEAKQPPEETPRAMPREDNRNFDGAWIFTSAGCPYTGSLPAMIAGGRILIRGGQRSGRSGWHIAFGRCRQWHDPYRGRTIVRKHGGRNIQPIRRLRRQLDRNQAVDLRMVAAARKSTSRAARRAATSSSRPHCSIFQSSST
jgi:hypothetical protein